MLVARPIRDARRAMRTLDILGKISVAVGSGLDESSSAHVDPVAETMKLFPEVQEQNYADLFCRISDYWNSI
jgi:hypothetical protein